MKKIYLIPLLAAILFMQEQVFAQCPALSPNSVTLDCSTPCATLNVTPIAVNYNETTSYTVTSVPYSTTYPFTGGTAVTGLTDDVWASAPVALPFKFCYFGHTYDKILIGSNGNVTFDTSLAGAYDPWPISGPIPGSNCTATDNAIMFSWMDYLITSGGGINYAFYGTAPCRVMVVNYNNVSFYSCTGTHGTQQMVIYEGTNLIQMNSEAKPICAGWNSGYAVSGIENSCYCAASGGGPINYTVPGENGVDFTMTDQSWQFAPAGPTSPWVYTWTGPSGVVGTGTSVVLCPTVTTVYTVTATSAACTGGVSAMGTATVTVTSTTTPITGTPSMCLGYTTDLTDATAGGVWTSSNTLVATVNTTGIVSSVSGGTAIISYSAAGCTSTMVVTVNTAPAITGDVNICEGGTSTLADAVTGGTWTSSNTGVATIGLTTGIVNGVSPGLTNITYVTPAGCSTTTTVNIFVLNTIGGTKTVCQGMTTTLSDISPGGTWSSASTTIATIAAGTGVVTGVSGGTANITYSTGGGCYVTTVVTVNPVSPITGTLVMCQNFTTTLGDALPGGSWTSDATGIATVNSSTGVVTGVTGGNAIISYTLPTGCLMTTDVTVHPKPAPPVPTPQQYCSNYIPTSVAATPATGLTWYGPGVTPPMTVAPTPATPLTAGIITYYVTETSSFGCVSDSAVDNITVIAQPNPPVTSNTSYCQYSTILPLNSQVDSSSGSYLTWFALSTGGSPLAGVPTVNDSSVTYPGANTYYVAQTVDGCISNRAPVSVTIVYKPSFTITASRNWVCDHDTLTFAYSSTAPLLEGSYLWQLPVGTSVVGGSDTSSAIAVQFDSVYNHDIIYLTVGELNNMCSTQNSVQVSVIALPTATGYMNPNICIGDTVNLALSSESSDASIFGWYIDGIPMTNSGAINIVAANSNSGGPYSLRWNDTGSHIITVTTTTSQGCKSLPTNDTVDVHALPVATFTYKSKSSDVLCLEDSVQFIATNVNDNDSYLWQPAHGFNNDNKPVIWGKVEETQSDITLTVTDPFGCVGMYTQQLDPGACCTVLFPNAFTPNGDGKNDVFRPLFNGYHNFHFFRIVNRWGETIFESSNSLPAWDGTFNGVSQDIGTYYYFIQYDCGGNTIEAKGDVTLIR